VLPGGLINDSGDTTTEAKTKTNPISSLTVSDTIVQSIHVCVPHKRPRLLIKYILRVREQEKAEKVRQVSSMLIFCTTIKTAGFVHGFLNSQNVATEILHGQLNQDQRERTLKNFRAGKISVLVSTDVAARGIHIKNLKYVVNYDFPNTLEQYCHRIGRTGRQDASTGGQAYSFFTRNMAPMAPDLLTLLNRCNQVPEPNLVLLAQSVQRGDEIILEENDDEEEDGKEEGRETSE
jgi:ATP-dependent RNA helicase DDX5/DBP2